MIDHSKSPTSLRVEATLFEASRRHGFPSPRLLGHAPNYGWIERDRVDGPTLAEWLQTAPGTVVRHRVICDLARTLGGLHACLSNDQAISALGLPQSGTDAVIEELERQCIALGTRDLLRTLELAKRAPRDRDHLVLIHGDLSPHNIVLTTTGPALLDWEEASWAPAELDVAFITCTANDLCTSASEARLFEEHYERSAPRPLSRMPLYRLLDATLQVTAAMSVGDGSSFLKRQLAAAEESYRRWEAHPQVLRYPSAT